MADDQRQLPLLLRIPASRSSRAMVLHPLRSCRYLWKMRRTDLSSLPMWNIKFSDGVTIGAYPEEIIPSEMKENGCLMDGIENGGK